MMKYNLILLFVFGILFSCKKQDEQKITYCNKDNSIIFSSKVFISIPNLYSPDANGLNDVIIINSRPKMTNLDFELYNADGDLLYNNQLDTNYMFILPYEGKQRFSKDEVLNYQLKCDLDTIKINTSGKIVLIHDVEEGHYQIDNCDLCFLGDMVEVYPNDSLVRNQTNDLIKCD